MKSEKTAPANGCPIFDGFSYYGPDTVAQMRAVNPERYADARHLDGLEKQPDPSLPDEDYHRVIVALRHGEIIGMLICQWTNNRYFPFWLYHMKFVDVDKSYQHQSVATHLVHALNAADFLEQKILYLGIFSNPGKRYLKPVCSRVLDAKKYALVSSRNYLRHPPPVPGDYSR